jgi:hypothetical protein
MLPKDCTEFLAFVQKRDPVVVVPWTSNSASVEEVLRPCSTGGFFCLWNQSLIPTLSYREVQNAANQLSYQIDSTLPILEFSNSSEVEWLQRPALLQGRIYTGIKSDKGKAFNGWYEALVRWIRRSFRKNPIGHLGGYIGPAAFEWYKHGGVLLPMFTPPLTSEWRSWLEAQDSLRNVS